MEEWLYQVRFTLLHADYMPAELITVLEVYNAIPISIDNTTANVPKATSNANGSIFNVPTGFGLSQHVSFIQIFSYDDLSKSCIRFF